MVVSWIMNRRFDLVRQAISIQLINFLGDTRVDQSPFAFESRSRYLLRWRYRCLSIAFQSLMRYQQDRTRQQLCSAAQGARTYSCWCYIYPVGTDTIHRSMPSTYLVVASSTTTEEPAVVTEYSQTASTNCGDRTRMRFALP